MNVSCLTRLNAAPKWLDRIAPDSDAGMEPEDAPEPPHPARRARVASAPDAQTPREEKRKPKTLSFLCGKLPQPVARP